MTTSFLVTGGTGTLGRPVAQRLRDAGADVTVLSRHPRDTAEGIRYTAGDLSTGEGIQAAAQGAKVIVHCAGSSKGDEQKTRTLVSAATDARHIVLISVVGADLIPQVSAIDRALFGYFGMKLATERVVEQSGTGWNRDPVGAGITGSFASALATVRIRSWNWVARSVVQPVPDCSTTRSVASFMPK